MAMRIMIVAGSVPPKVGGSQISIALTVRGLVERGATVNVATSNYPDQELLHFISSSGGRVLVTQECPTEATWDAQILGPSNELRRFIGECEVDVVHAYSHATAISTAIALADTARPLLCASFHEMSSDQDPAGRARSSFAHNLSRVDLIVPLSDYFAATASRYCLDQKKIRPARQGLDLQLLQHGDAVIGKTLLLEDGSRPIIVYPARWVPAKAQVDLLQAFALARRAGDGLSQHAVLCLVGSTSASPHVDSHSYYTRLIDMVESLGLKKSVKFITDVPRAKMAHIYAAASLVVAPSHREGLGFVGIEAMATQRPLIASRNEGFNQYCRDGENALTFDVGDVESLANLINQAIESDFYDARMASAARQTANKYSYSIGVGDLIDIYNSRLADKM